MMYITAAAEEDLPRILEIEREAISPPWTEGALLSEVYRTDSLFAVCQGDGSPDTPPTSTLGFVILRLAGDEGELFQIAVDKAARRQGVADLLMDAAFNYASENALASVYLEVRKNNEAAISLYEKHGFVAVRRRRDYYSDPIEDAVVMLKNFENTEVL